MVRCQQRKRLKKIFESKKLIAGNGKIKGGHKCICFAESPISHIAEVIARGQKKKMKYGPYGIMFDKSKIFELGGRPVIYQSKEEYDCLPESIKYRHVTYNPGEIDFCWERE